MPMVKLCLGLAIWLVYRPLHEKGIGAPLKQLSVIPGEP
jgi:hypothetical protein